MKKTLIEDPRLTPTMERLRSGSKQLFRERDPSNKEFLRSSNAEVILEHERKEMYAELIDGEWYWVSGCAACNGHTRSWKSYIECVEHDVCVSCGISRTEVVGSVWGGLEGWTCKPCKETQRLEAMAQAFEALGGEEPDCDYRDTVICPHCGTEGEDVYEDGDRGSCGEILYNYGDWGAGCVFFI